MIVDGNELNKLLKISGSFISDNPNLVEHSCFFIKITKNKMYITSSNGHSFCIGFVPISNVEEDLKMAINGDIFKNSISVIGKDCNVSLDFLDPVLVCSSSKIKGTKKRVSRKKIKLPLVSCEEFEISFGSEKKTIAIIDQKSLLKALPIVMNTCEKTSIGGNDNIKFTFKDDKLFLQSFQGSFATKHTIKNGTFKDEDIFYLSSEDVKCIKGILSSGEIKIQRLDNKIVFGTKTTQSYFSEISSDMPEIDDLIDIDGAVFIDRDEILEGISLSKSVLKKESSKVLSIIKEGRNINVGASSTKGECSYSFEYDGDSDDFDVKLRCDVLENFLRLNDVEMTGSFKDGICFLKTDVSIFVMVSISN